MKASHRFKTIQNLLKLTRIDSSISQLYNLNKEKGLSESIKCVEHLHKHKFYDRNRSNSNIITSVLYGGKERKYQTILISIAATGLITSLGSAITEDFPSFHHPFKLFSNVAYADTKLQRESELKTEPETEPNAVRKKRIVVLGSGWGAVSFLKGINTNLYDVIVLSPRNYFLFTPLLPEVSSGTVGSHSISEPIRRILYNKNKKAEFFEAECVRIDPVNKRVECRETASVTVKGKENVDFYYDYLIVSVGAQPNTFNTPGVAENCHFLKEVKDAERIRETIIDCFETANFPSLTEEEKRKLLHFVVIGGGPTGVEFAAELNDWIDDVFSKLYPNLKHFTKITLVELGDHILNMFDQRISDFAEKKFKRDKIDVKTGCKVVEVTENDIVIFDRVTHETFRMNYGIAIWSTGIGTRPLISNLMAQIEQKNRRALATDEWLRVKGAEGVYAIGDCATIEQRKMKDDIAYLFQMADVNKDGVLSVSEINNILNKVKERYPQLFIYLKRKSIRDLLEGVNIDEREDKSKNDKIPQNDKKDLSERVINLKEFESALSHVDNQMKSLPATAQVAAQQGDYLSKCFNKLENDSLSPEGPLRVRGEGRHRFQPFQYRHFGQFAPLGGGQAGFQLPGDWVNLGRSSQWLWYSVYASKQVSWRTRALVVFDWIKCAIFGRDSSRI